jgi:hypothetical protein
VEKKTGGWEEQSSFLFVRFDKSDTKMGQPKFVSYFANFFLCAPRFSRNIPIVILESES